MMKFDLEGSLSPQPKPSRRKSIHIGGNDRFVGDTHFGHALMTAQLKDADGNPLPKLRPFDDIDQHDEHLIANWNRMVGRTDKVFHLGDFSHPRVPLERRQAIFDRLKGRKVLLVGNHDDEGTLGLGWDEIYHGPVHLRDGLGQVVIAMHHPLFEWDGWHNGSVHIHGHTHNVHLSSRRRFDVGVDHIGSFPMTWSEIKDRMSNLPLLDINGVLLEPFKPDRGYPQPRGPGTH